jgi:hypothetical protein
MKWTVLAVLGLAACGSGTDYAAPYVANWTASATIEIQGSSLELQVLVPIKETGNNLIELQGFCSDNDMYADGPIADVTASGYTVRSDSCSFPSTTCGLGNIGFAWSSGSGGLSNDQLTGSVSGTLSCGTQSLTYSVSFTSTAKGAYGSLTTHGGKGLAEAIRLIPQ